MATTTHFVVPLPPHGKERPRFANGHTYTPKRTADWEEACAFCARAAKLPRLVGPLAVQVAAVMRRPKSLRCEGRSAAPVRPDIDNVVKIVLDALTYKRGSDAGWFDDAQVTELRAWKHYATRNEAPRVEVWITGEPERLTGRAT